MERVLAFGCHPDDIEFMASGTMALLGEKGYELHFATMAGGEAGSQTEPPQHIRERRLEEARNAAAIVGGTFHYAGGSDLEVEYNHHYRRLAIRLIREVDPAIVLTHAPSDYMIDHEETSRLVRNAVFIATVPNFDCGVPTTPTKRVPYLYYWNAAGLIDIFGRPLPIHFGVDVSSAIDRKEEMLACHASQRDWLRFINGIDSYLDAMRDWTRRQGETIGRPYGECFIQHLGNAYPTENILKEILGELVVGM
ncbi:MAG TPA: PIG-L family deacetylase [Spirochaetia bacterium]|nr:PIG-L family deacetylase [Spirochaetia bacterium]